MRKPESDKPKQPATVVMTRMRGKARIEGEWIVLDPESAEEYAPALEKLHAAEFFDPQGSNNPRT